MFVPSGFDDSSNHSKAIFKAGAEYSLTDDELEEILSCSDVPVLTAQDSDPVTAHWQAHRDSLAGSGCQPEWE